MGGIGLPLVRRAAHGSLSAGLGVQISAVAGACGPWLATVLAVMTVGLAHRGPSQADAISLFTIIIIYNFAFSLLIASPVVLVVSRRLADQIYAGDIGEASGLLLGGLFLVLLVQSLLAVPYYGFLVDLEPALRLLAIAGFLIVGGIWVAAAFLAARKEYMTISAIFALGMATGAFLSCLPGTGAGEMLAGFTAGLALILFLLLGKVLGDYPVALAAPLSILGALKEHRHYALVGLLYVLGAWIDKWIMWLTPGRQVFAGAMYAHPAYDAATFLAFLSVIPAMAVFFLCMEKRLLVTYRAYYRDVGNHATLAEIRANQGAILDDLRHTARRIVILQTSISYILILLAPQLVEAARGGTEMVPIFRFAVLGALFHVMIVFIMLVLSYFDFRALLLRVAGAFLLMNAGFTAAALLLGPSFYGYGYLLASVLGLLYAYQLSQNALSRLPYMTFVANNKGLH